MGSDATDPAARTRKSDGTDEQHALTEEQREVAEDQRQVAEDQRDKAEESRLADESLRRVAETTRDAAEQLRRNAEHIRQTAEDKRNFSASALRAPEQTAAAAALPGAIADQKSVSDDLGDTAEKTQDPSIDKKDAS
jgi:hypothetical protein